MTGLSRLRLAVAAGAMFACTQLLAAQAQQPDPATVVKQIDARVKARIDGIAQYTVTEHYAVYRNKDENHPVAEMMVKTDYRHDAGKTYTILSQSGSEAIRRLVLGAILDNEKRINEPGVREGTWITSANYDMKLKSNATERIGDRDCLALSLTPKRKAPFLIEGTVWVDAKTYSIVQLQGSASKSPSIFTGATQVMRQYADVMGFSEATHARAVSNSFLFGETVVKIDYRDYQIQMQPAK